MLITKFFFFKKKEHNFFFLPLYKFDLKIDLPTLHMEKKSVPEMTSYEARILQNDQSIGYVSVFLIFLLQVVTHMGASKETNTLSAEN